MGGSEGYAMTDGDRRGLIVPPAQPWAAPDPALLRGVPSRRVFSYCFDLLIILLLEGIAVLVFVPAAILSFGLLATPLSVVFGLIPITYHTVFIGGPGAATPGQRLFDLRVIDILDGAGPSYVQAFLQCAVFYVSVALTSFLILLFMFFNPARRTVHDWVSGTLVVRRSVEHAMHANRPVRP
jgi:uncharacterized RDD family membrane protein YckC